MFEPFGSELLERRRNGTVATLATLPIDTERLGLANRVRPRPSE
jgi:hypothetical protein